MFKTTIGLEVHAELKTQTKIFCACKNKFGDAPNTHVCPVCLGYPGTLPTLNEQAVSLAVLAGAALNCTIHEYSRFDRKHYFYPDLPKGYQISQYYYPICTQGYLDIGNKKIRINRIHLEEDAGKLIHEHAVTLVDLNRGGVPLIEIVTEPDFSNAQEVDTFLQQLQAILRWCNIADCKMQEGGMRADVNLSVSETDELGVRCEMKNIASFKAVGRAINYEEQRQIALLSSGKKVEQQTRRWDDEAGKSLSMRDKQDFQGYAYYPEPDLLPVCLTKQQINEIVSHLPLLPQALQKNMIEQLGLSQYDASLLCKQRFTAQLFLDTIKYFDSPKQVCNFILSEVLRAQKGEEELNIDAPALAQLLQLLHSGQINVNGAKQIFESLLLGNTDVAGMAKALGSPIDNAQELLQIVQEIVAANPKAVSEYRAGNKKSLAFFVGQLMKRTQGKADPKVCNQVVLAVLEEEQ